MFREIERSKVVEHTKNIIIEQLLVEVPAVAKSYKKYPLTDDPKDEEDYSIQLICDEVSAIRKVREHYEAQGYQIAGWNVLPDECAVRVLLRKIVPLKTFAEEGKGQSSEEKEETSAENEVAEDLNL